MKGSVSAHMKLVGFSNSNKVKNHWSRETREKSIPHYCQLKLRRVMHAHGGLYVKGE